MLQARCAVSPDLGKYQWEPGASSSPTWRFRLLVQSLRDIEACLRAQPTKLYHMGLRGTVSRSALANTNESRDKRIFAEFAHALICIARRLYAQEPLKANSES